MLHTLGRRPRWPFVRVPDRPLASPEPSRLSQAAGYEPFSLHVDPESLARNSRVEVYVLGEFVDDLQGTREERAERVQQEE
jgi:hypothetical protein